MKAKGSLDAILFDVGFTLLFQNEQITLAPLKRLGISPSREQLFAAERFSKLKLDDALLSGRPKSVDAQFWRNYHQHLMNSVGIKSEEIEEELISLCRSSANWTRVAEGAFDVLRTLKQSFRLGVITNSDGRMAAGLERLGFGELFETVIDSGSIGSEKPAVKIFHAAAESLRLAPEACLYIGDIYSVDYLGATTAGLGALVMDVAGVYEGRGISRVASLEELPAALEMLFLERP